MDVTPQISADDEIILHIHPTISDVEDQVKVINYGDGTLELPLALSSIRETDSIVFARSGQVVVLGGLMQNKSLDTNAGAPLVGNLPVVGHLFNQQRSASTKSELVILLKPLIMGPDGLPGVVEESEQRLNNIRKRIDSDFMAHALRWLGSELCTMRILASVINPLD